MTKSASWRSTTADPVTLSAGLLTAALFALLFVEPAGNVARAWWTDPEAGHGLLLAPLGVWLAWRRGLVTNPRPQPALGLATLGVAVALRLLGALAAEAFAGRLALLAGLAGLVIYLWGARQLWAWWLPATLLALSVPLPEILTGSLALPLQLRASRLGAALLQLRGIPVRLDGNVIRLPGRELFVTEACSGLRSLTALLSLAVLLGGLRLTRTPTRVTLLLLSIPIAVLLNGLRVFLTGFLVVFADPRLAEGFMHLTEGWLMFLVAFAALAGVAWVLARAEHRLNRGVHA
ncbi:MAG: exosortase/archaeosortase family protein [Gemmatimonadaceae bacterium]